MQANAHEIMGLESAFWTALQKQDVEAALALTDEPCIVTGAQGYASIDRETFAKMMKSDEWKLEKFELIGEPAVLFAGPDTAVVAYKVREEMTVDGKPLTLEAADSSTWVRRDGSWKCALHSESILGDPFGRDKAPTRS